MLRGFLVAMFVGVEVRSVLHAFWWRGFSVEKYGLGGIVCYMSCFFIHIRTVENGVHGLSSQDSSDDIQRINDMTTDSVQPVAFLKPLLSFNIIS